MELLSNTAKMRSTCSAWANRTLSLKGRVTVFYSLIYSLQYVHNNTVTHREYTLKSGRLRPHFYGLEKEVKWHIMLSFRLLQMAGLG